MDAYYMKRKQYTNPFMPVNITFEKAIRDYGIWFHLLDEGEEIHNGLIALYSMTRTLYAARQSKILAAALPVMEAMHKRGTWQAKDLQLMAQALEIVGRQYPALPRDVARKAIAEVLS